MHRSSNPYTDQLLDTSRYYNNLDDMEIDSLIESINENKESEKKDILW